MAAYSGSDKRIKYLFENGGGGGSSSLAGLSDVNLSSPTDGEVLTFDANNNEWINAAGGSGGGSGGMCYLNTMYSENEQKIGYWTDGKPLYQKTKHISSVPSNAYDTIPLNISNIDKCVDYKGVVLYSNGIFEDFNFNRPDGANNTFYTAITSDGDLFFRSYEAITAQAWVTLQYTKTTDSADPNPQQGGVIYLPSIYSEEEREVGVWTDGKPLYQKTWDLSPDIEITSSGVLLPSYVSNDLANAENIIWAIAERERNGSSILPAIIHAYVWNSSTTGTAYSVLSADRWSNVSKITIQYTKTTDTAGSGSWTPSGAPAVHYSTNEQVVGTWVDGSTLYERTYFLDNISSSATEYVVDNSFGNNKTMHSMDVQFSGMTNTLGKYINSISDTLYVDSGVLKYYIAKTGSWWNALNSCYITIRYTKSS